MTSWRSELCVTAKQHGAEHSALIRYVFYMLSARARTKPETVCATPGPCVTELMRMEGKVVASKSAISKRSNTSHSCPSACYLAAEHIKSPTCCSLPHRGVTGELLQASDPFPSLISAGLVTESPGFVVAWVDRNVYGVPDRPSAISNHRLKMPALTISTQHERPSFERRRSASPPRPPVSPITPVLSPATLVPSTELTAALAPPSTITPPSTFNQPTCTAPPSVEASFIQRPAPVPISESENTDVIALRSAISILQLQRERSKADLRALQTLKEKAVAEPEEFAQDLLAGRIDSADQSRGLLGADLEDVSHHRDRGEMKTPPSIPNADATGDKMDIDGDADDSKPYSTNYSKFSPIPTPQNVVRCPPINWAKYHVVGESLDKLHEEQRRRPTQGEPQRDGSGISRAPVSVVAAPYRPFADRVAEPMRTRSGGKR